MNNYSNIIKSGATWVHTKFSQAFRLIQMAEQEFMVH